MLHPPWTEDWLRRTRLEARLWRQLPPSVVATLAAQERADMPGTLAVWTIYEGATDVSTPFCVRVWHTSADGLAPGPGWGARSLEEARSLVPAGLVLVPRCDGDEAVVVESWL